MDKMLEKEFKGKKILVTGGTGSIGSQIVKKLLKYNPDVIRVFSNDENSTFYMKQELSHVSNVRYLMGDIRDKERLILAMENIDIVYHAAALKHVPLCEYNPFEAIKTNVMGTQNVIEAALACGVGKVINISTDKAVNPVNTMGATKLLAEKCITDANDWKGLRKTIFSSVRFGNVLFSRGSVVPLFEKQIRENKKITLTDPEMTRFVMKLSSTLDLVFKATLMAKGGEIFILKMPVVKLGDLADVVIEENCKKYKISKNEVKKETIGPRVGEKIFEELMTESEAFMAFETDDMLIIPPQLVLPDLSFEVTDYKDAKNSKLNRYVSREVTPLSKKEIKTLLFGSLKEDEQSCVS